MLLFYLASCIHHSICEIHPCGCEFLLLVHSHCWIVFHYMNIMEYYNLFTHSTSDVTFGVSSFCVSNVIAMNIPVHAFGEHLHVFLICGLAGS